MPLDPNRLPDPAALRLRAKALAMLEAIISPDWEDRYFSFDAGWGTGEEMASMRNGSGDDWFVLFGPFGAAIKGFAHETPLARTQAFAAAVQKQVPGTFATFLSEPAFSMEWASFCYWRGLNDSIWHKVAHPDPVLTNTDDGSEEFLALLIEPPSSYVEFAKWYYEIDVPVAAVESIFRHAALTGGLVESLNAGTTITQAAMWAAEIGYPVERTDA